MRKWVTCLLIGFLILGFTKTANAVTVRFDDVTTFGGIDSSTPYYGLFWSNAAIANKNLTNLGFRNAAVSGDYSAYNSSNNYTLSASYSGQPFTFNGAFFTSFYDDEILAVNGYKMGAYGVPTYSDTVTVNGLTPVWKSFDYKDVIRVSISVSQKITNEYYDRRFAIDDFTYNEPAGYTPYSCPLPSTPEPSSILLGLLGLSGLAGIKRKIC